MVPKFYGEHAQASSTTLRIIMSDTSERMEFSPTRLAQVAACEKLRDTVTGISALHKSLHETDRHSPSPRNSCKELYLSSTHAMNRRKEEMVSELKTLPSSTRLDCHKIPSTSVEEEINFEPSLPENKIKTNSKSNNKKLSKKRKNKGKESTSLSFPKRPPDQFPPPQPRTP
ncbi:hypothetical protein TNCV_232311 [Trichonephila clavipes]|nr:hypothetical protein TNCV_232311 [Trichonephila clavipes]